MRTKAVITIAAALLAAGCATGAQQEVTKIRTEFQSARAANEQCAARLAQTAAYQKVKDNLPPIRADDPVPLSVLTNARKATDDEIAALYALHVEVGRCRSVALEGASRVHQGLVVLLADTFSEGDANYVRLVRRELTYGQFAELSQQRLQRYRQRFTALAAEVDRSLAQTHAQEMQQRQAAANALMTWAMLQQQLNQQQQLINAITRPQTTTCHYVGRHLNCVTN
jgi:hypothetical protein